jgi:hypothetical protein
VTRVPRRLVEGGLALAIAGLLGGGVVAAADQREDRRVRLAAERAERAEREEQRRAEEAARARTAYLARVTAAVEQVFDHVQPVQQALGAVEEDKFASLQVLDDVLRRGGAASAVAARGRELAAATPPDAMLDAALDLDVALDDLTAALTDLQRLPADRESAAYADALLDGDVALDLATADLTRAVEVAFGDDPLPRLPLANGLRSEGAQPVSKGGYLLTAGGYCASGADRRVDADTTTPAAFVRSVERELAEVRRTVRLLRGVRGPARDASAIAALEGALDGTATLARGLQQLRTAVALQDGLTYQASLRTLDEADRELARIARAYRGYGSTSCADFFAP